MTQVGPNYQDLIASGGGNRFAEDLRTKLGGSWVRMAGPNDVIDLSDVARLPEAYARAGGQAVIAAGAGMLKGAEHVMTIAKQQTPVRFGFLRDSGHVKPPVWEGDILTIELAFGGVAAPYAVHVHEDLNAHHRVGKAKFLEDPMNQEAQYVIDQVAQGIAAIMGGA